MGDSRKAAAEYEEDVGYAYNVILNNVNLTEIARIYKLLLKQEEVSLFTKKQFEHLTESRSNLLKIIEIHPDMPDWIRRSHIIEAIKS